MANPNPTQPQASPGDGYGEDPELLWKARRLAQQAGRLDAVQDLEGRLEKAYHTKEVTALTAKDYLSYNRYRDARVGIHRGQIADVATQEDPEERASAERYNADVKAGRVPVYHPPNEGQVDINPTYRGGRPVNTHGPVSPQLIDTGVQSTFAAADQEETQLLQALNLAQKAGKQDAVDDLRARLVRAQKTKTEAGHQLDVNRMSPRDQLWAGVGHGMAKIPAAIAAGTGHPFASFDKEGKQNSERLLATGPGSVGDFAGEQAILTPLSMFIGSGLKAGAGAAERAGLPTAAKVLRSNTLATTTEGATQGALLDPDHPGRGAAGGAMLGLLSRAGRGMLPNPAQPVTLSPEGKAMLDQGVPLSVGQAAGRNSAVGRLEGSLEGVPGAGLVTEKRAAGAAGGRLGAIQRTVADGTQIPSNLTRVPDQIKYAFDSFDKPTGYAQFTGIPVPQQHVSALPGLVRNQLPKDGLSNETRAAVDWALDEAFSTLPKPTPSGIVGPRGPIMIPARQATVGDLIAARQWVRRAEREFVNDPVKKRAIETVQPVFDQVINAALPDQAARDGLALMDRKYAQLNTLAKAAAAAPGTEQEFWGTGLHRALRARFGDRATATGQTGDLGTWATLMDKTLPDPPKTGYRLASLGFYGALASGAGISHPVASAAMFGVPAAKVALGTWEPGRRFLLGQYDWQKGVNALVDALRNRGTAPGTHPLLRSIGQDVGRDALTTAAGMKFFPNRFGTQEDQP